MQATTASYCVILLSKTISSQTEQLVIDVFYCEMGSHKKRTKKENKNNHYKKMKVLKGGWGIKVAWS